MGVPRQIPFPIVPPNSLLSLTALYPSPYYIKLLVLHLPHLAPLRSPGLLSLLFIVHLPKYIRPATVRPPSPPSFLALHRDEHSHFLLLFILTERVQLCLS